VDFGIYKAKVTTGTFKILCVGGLYIEDTITGGAGTFTIDASNKLYWNGNEIAFEIPK
jgi:hypothetical protein